MDDALARTKRCWRLAARRADGCPTKATRRITDRTLKTYQRKALKPRLEQPCSLTEVLATAGALRQVPLAFSDPLAVALESAC